MMTEQSLEQLGFLKEESFDSIDSSEPDFHYYVLDIGSICLISNDSDDANENGWYVEFLEGGVRFTEIEPLRDLITLLTDHLDPKTS
jgi:hypothetical protein